MAEQKKSTTPRKSSTTGKEAKPKAAPKTATAKKAAPKAAAARSSAPRTRKAAANTVNEEMRLRMVREAAYYRALNRGFSGGAEQEDWFAAEREIDVMLGKLTS